MHASASLPAPCPPPCACPAPPPPACLPRAQPLDKLERAELVKQAAAFVAPGFKLVMAEKVDAKLLGGFVLEFEDRLVDMSVAKKLEEFNNLVFKLEVRRTRRGVWDRLAGACTRHGVHSGCTRSQLRVLPCLQGDLKA